MEDPNRDNVIDLVPADDHDRQAQLIRRFRQRQEVQRQAGAVPIRPQREAPDQRTWLGGKRESPALQKHNAQMSLIERSAREADYTIQWANYLEYHGFKNAGQTIATMERELLQIDPYSLTAEIMAQMFLDGAERIRLTETDVLENFRRKALNR